MQSYGNGDVEEKLGTILKDFKRSDWFLATKFGIRPAPDGRCAPAWLGHHRPQVVAAFVVRQVVLHASHNGDRCSTVHVPDTLDPALCSRRARGDAPYIRECIEGSLRRLQTPYVDLYYVHRVDRTRPVEVRQWHWGCVCSWGSSASAAGCLAGTVLYACS